MPIILIISVGHNVCKEIWNPTLGEELNVRIKPNDYVDKSAVSVEKIEIFLDISVRKTCKYYLNSFEMTFTRNLLRKTSGKIYNVKDVGPL